MSGLAQRGQSVGQGLLLLPRRAEGAAPESRRRVQIHQAGQVAVQSHGAARAQIDRREHGQRTSQGRGTGARTPTSPQPFAGPKMGPRDSMPDAMRQMRAGQQTSAVEKL